MIDQDDNEDADLEMLRKHAGMLSEHFETVQIFATKLVPDGGTITVSQGSGNWYARYGQIKEWCVKQDETTRKNVRGEE